MRKIIKTGHSLAVTMPGSMLKELGLKLGDMVKLEYNKEAKSVTIKPGGKSSEQLGLNFKIRPKM